MGTSLANSNFSTAAGDCWRNVLDDIPTVFGRLVYLASLRPGDGNREIGHAHLQVFSQWLTLGLSDQIRDLRAYAGSGTELPPADHRDLVPAHAREVERQLFFTDGETLRDLLRVEPGGFASSML